MKRLFLLITSITFVGCSGADPGPLFAGDGGVPQTDACVGACDAPLEASSLTDVQDSGTPMDSSEDAPEVNVDAEPTTNQSICVVSSIPKEFQCLQSVCEQTGTVPWTWAFVDPQQPCCDPGGKSVPVCPFGATCTVTLDGGTYVGVCE